MTQLHYGAVTGLSEPAEEVTYMVSRVVVNALLDRSDLAFRRASDANRGRFTSFPVPWPTAISSPAAESA